MIIAIDGPSGAGKSTLGKMLARKLGLLYLDTGAMYRAVAVAAERSAASLDDAEAVTEAAEDAEIVLQRGPAGLVVLLDGDDISEAIRTPHIGQAASKVSTIPGVRKCLVSRQRELGEAAEKGAVLDGRDIGTVVFPNADIKFFLTARAEARAERRYREDLEKGRSVSFEQTVREISERDERDATREDSPLMIAEDSFVIDTSEMSLEEVFETMIGEVNRLERADAGSAEL